MTKNAQLLVNHPLLMLEKLGGLTVFERQLFSLRRAGLERVWIHTRKPSEETLSGLRLPQGLEIFWAASAAPPPPCLAPYMGVSGDHLVRVETLSHIAQASYPAPASYHDAQDASVVTLVPFAAEKQSAPQKLPLPEGSSVFLTLPLDGGPAQDWILTQGPKNQDGFMARHFDRYISLSISRLLLGKAISPNAVTLLSLGVGLAGSFLFIFTGHVAAVCAAALVWLHCVLDGCDGELARLRFQESSLGSDLDFWTDNLVHLALFGGIGYGFYRTSRNPLFLGLAFAADAGVLAAAGLEFWRKIKRRRQETPPGDFPPGLFQRIESFLAQRDFIYVLLALACWNLTYYFLWAGAIGAPLFFLLMLGTGHDKIHEKPNP